MMSAEPPNDVIVMPDDPTNELQEAYAFFAQRIREWVGEADEGAEEERFDQLRVGAALRRSLSDLHARPQRSDRTAWAAATLLHRFLGVPSLPTGQIH